MGKVTVKMVQASMEIEEADDKHKHAIIEGFFQALGGTRKYGAQPSLAPSVKPVAHVQSFKEETKSKPIIPSCKPVTYEQPIQEETKLTSTPKETKAEIVKPDLLNSERSLHIPIGEQRPEHWDTGIKDKNGVDHYRCRLHCPNPDCGHQRNLYIPEDRKEVTCPECKEKIEVRFATADGFPNRDPYGNFFMADESIYR